MKYFRTGEKHKTENYPYGFRLRTTRYEWIEFKNNYGFRMCTQTINPKTGRENKPKRGTYHHIALMYLNEEDHAKMRVWDYYGDEGIQNTLDFIKQEDNFKLFTPEEITWIYLDFLRHIKADIVAKMTYCNSKQEEIMPFYKENLSLLLNGYKSKGTINTFKDLKFDWKGIKGTEEEGYKPFKVTEYGVIT